MTKITYSKYQLDIFDKYDNTNKNLAINAKPGSGKSFVLLELLKRTPRFKKCILLAFNKSIQTELESKVPEGVKVSTIHSLAYGILRRNTSQNYKLNQYKNFILGKKCLDLSKMKEKEKDAYLFTISKIIDLSRLNIVKNREGIESICDQYNISTINGEIDDTLKLLEELDNYNSRDHKDYLIDFTDMLWLTFLKVKRQDYIRYDVVMLDEAQDLCPLQQKIVENIINMRGRLILCGDENQGIYNFIGANLQSFTELRSRPNTIILPLSMTYRCGKKIVEEANKIFPGLEAFEENPEAIVRRGSLDEVEDGDFVICRNNMPLVESWIKIIKQNKKATILGRDFGQNLLTLVSKLSNYKDIKEGVLDILKKKEDQLQQKGIQKPRNNQSYQALLEKLTIIEILKNEFGSFDMMERRINEIFSDDNSKGIVLLTGHKSKGLEAKRVFFLQKDLIPSKYAVTPQELLQESCLLYVITTRAKQELIYVD
jgi:DNA helicase-2/ATP-dependent DNA helicase PcrA